MKHPIQPLIKDKHDVLRFKKNEIVSFLLDQGGFDMKKLGAMPFSDEDREQFAQLIGYSLSGFAELSYVSDETYEAARELLEDKNTEQEARISVLDNKLNNVREKMREKMKEVITELFEGIMKELKEI